MAIVLESALGFEATAFRTRTDLVEFQIARSLSGDWVGSFASSRSAATASAATCDFFGKVTPKLVAALHTTTKFGGVHGLVVGFFAADPAPAGFVLFAVHIIVTFHVRVVGAEVLTLGGIGVRHVWQVL